MKPELKEQLDRITGDLTMAFHGLRRVRAEVQPGIDQRALDAIIKDLAWAVENCHVIGLHMIGQALDDTMGYTPSASDPASEEPA